MAHAILGTRKIGRRASPQMSSTLPAGCPFLEPVPPHERFRSLLSRTTRTNLYDYLIKSEGADRFVVTKNVPLHGKTASLWTPPLCPALIQDHGTVVSKHETAHLAQAIERPFKAWDYGWTCSEAPKLLGPRRHNAKPVVFPQVRIAKYTVDFLVMFWDWRNLIRQIAIECDGHDFHERTRQQTWHDKRRDRFFASNSIFVMRFTGGEIKRDPVECAAEVYRATAYIAHGGPSAQLKGVRWLLSEAELEAMLEEEERQAETEEANLRGGDRGLRAQAD